MEIATKDLNIPAHYMDQIPKSKEWKQNYYVDPDLSGSDIECSLWLYMDGSKMEQMLAQSVKRCILQETIINNWSGVSAQAICQFVIDEEHIMSGHFVSECITLELSIW